MMKEPAETRYFNAEQFELLGGNPDTGFASKEKAEKLAAEWKVYPKGGKTRIVKFRDRYWVYGV
jgi:hypothetical protein